MPTVSIQKADLLRVAKAMHTVCDPRTTIPVLAEVLLDFGEGRATFCATILDHQITMTVEAETDGQTKCLVNGKRLFAFAKTAQNTARISLEPPKAGALNPLPVLVMKSGDLVMHNLVRIETSDFPTMSITKSAQWRNEAHSLTASQADLRRLLTLGRHCVCKNETPFHLNGTFLTKHPNKSHLRAVTADGHRMTVVDSQIDATSSIGILPGPALPMLLPLLTEGENEPVNLRYFDRFLTVTIGDTEFATKLIDGTYPDYTRVIPAPTANGEAQLSAESVRRLDTLASTINTARSVACAINLAEGTMSVEYGEDSVSLPISSKGEFTAGINLKYLRDQVRATPELTMHINSPSDPIRMFGPDPDALFILMPVRL